MKCFPLILAEGASLDGLIHLIELVIGATALPGLVGLAVLVAGRFRAPAASPALILGLSTVLPAGFCLGWVWREKAWVGYAVAAGLPLLLGLVTCALAWWSHQRPVLPPRAITPSVEPR